MIRRGWHASSRRSGASEVLEPYRCAVEHLQRDVEPVPSPHPGNHGADMPMTTSGDARAVDPRLGEACSGAWVDLVEIDKGERVLLIGSSSGPAMDALASRTARLHLVDARDRAQPMPWLDDHESSIDLAIIDGVDIDDDDWRRVVSTLGPAGRLVVVHDNPRSPLRAIDRLTGSQTAEGFQARPAAVRDRMERAELRVEHQFGLLRSSIAPVTAVDLDAPRAAAAILDAATTRVGSVRRSALRVLARALGRHRGRDWFPAYLVMGRKGPAAPDARDRITGRIGYADAVDGEVVRGEPPCAIDKRHETPESADAEAMALQALVDLAVVPQLVRRLDPVTLRQQWIDGDSLNPHALRRRSAIRWAERAATLLADIHRRTVDTDGSVLVHGDFWLGNILVKGDKIVALVDWSTAHRGAASTDIDHLAETLADAGCIRADQISIIRDRLASICDISVASTSD